MFVHKHNRQESLRSPLKALGDGCETPGLGNSGSNSPQSLLSSTGLRDTPKLIACVVQPLDYVLTELSEPSPVASETDSFPRVLDDSRWLRVFNKTIRRLPCKRKLIGCSPGEVSSPELPPRRDSSDAAGKQKKPHERLLYRGKASPTRIAQRQQDWKILRLCATSIQRVWRGRRVRQQYLLSRRRRYEKAAAYLLGWKCRRILRLSPVVKLIEKIKSAGPRPVRRVKRELLEQFATLWSGEWPQHCKRGRESPRTECFSPADQRKPPRLPFSASKTEGSVASTEESCSVFSPAKAYDQRASPDRADFPRESIDPLLQEFLLLERCSERRPDTSLLLRLLPVPFDDSPKTVIPQLREDSAFLLSLRRIDHMQLFRELKQLLVREFAVLKQ